MAQVSLGSTAADVVEAEIDRRVKHVNLDLLTIKAPFAGGLGRHKVTLGQNVSPGDAMVDLVDQASIAVDFHVPERRLAQVRQGAAISFQSDASGDQALPVRSRSLQATVDPSDAQLRGAWPRSTIRIGYCGRACSAASIWP